MTPQEKHERRKARLATKRHANELKRQEDMRRKNPRQFLGRIKPPKVKNDRR